MFAGRGVPEGAGGGHPQGEVDYGAGGVKGDFAV